MATKLRHPIARTAYLAIVAREYGVRISSDEIRYNPGEKESICRLLGNDNRVRDTCQQYRIFERIKP